MEIKRNGKIQDILECPYCGGEDYYRVTIVTGKTAYYYNFDGTDGENGQLHDPLNYREQKTLFCGNCQKKLGYLIK